MLGKMMLPFIGGAPSGWAVAMFFFQTCLLAGYAIAYLFSKLPPLLNALAIIALLVPGALFLPITYQGDSAVAVTPFVVFIHLTLSAAVPFMALSTLAPGMQRLFAFSNHRTAGDPYYLYAASNIGSFTGLLADPLILEPLVGLEAQSFFWMALYGLLFVCVTLCTLTILRSNKTLLNLRAPVTAQSHLLTQQDEKPVTWSRRLNWILLAVIPSSLMIGVTTEITTDIASAPMIWVIPLGLYLLTNIAAFASRITIKTRNLGALHILAIVIINIHIMMGISLTYSSLLALMMTLLYLFGFTVTAMTLHSRLANDRPATNKLTEFYFFLALGGALGGSFNAFIAPVIFNDIYEFQAVLILSLIFNPAFQEKVIPALKRPMQAILILSAPLIAGAIVMDTHNFYFYAPFVLLMFFAAVHVKTLFIISVMVFTALVFDKSQYEAIDRNFFGVLKVFEQNLNRDENLKVKVLTHGTTIHGFQPADKNYALKPGVYYGRQGPVGDLLAVTNPKEIAALGLGTGQLACHNKTGRHFTFYELDPQVIDFAKTYFTALEGCGYKDIIIGDARLELEKTQTRYDAVFVDTFSSDAIPMHLITKEAIDLYFSRLEEDGYVAINISNRHLDLTRPLAATAAENGYLYRDKLYNQQPESPYEISSQWVVLTKNKKIISRLDKKGWKPLKTSARPWTDDYSNYLSILKIMNFNQPQKTQTQQEN
jgi:spermidine synthase